MVTIKGQPQGKDRPRFRNVGNFVQTYTTKKTRDYETLVRTEYQRQCGKRYGKKEIKVQIKAFYEIPNSWSKKKKMQAEMGEFKPAVKPDLDNIAKAICDALNDVAYEDDKQICELVVEKKYSSEPRVEINIFEIA